MNKGLLNKDTFAERYPEQKPVCLNYATVREDMLALAVENTALRALLSMHNNHLELENRNQVLVLLIADYLTDWTDDETSVMSVKESIAEIESYGHPFCSGSRDLVVNAIRHFIHIVNPWNRSTLPDILMEMGFTEVECNQFLKQ